ncbi:adhesion G-protein coupled receptor G2-like [Pomacea canaliculata]|uniref:adhesion G-protein coupled receptor G2-like n=1 Tax=Pomacea canaliculata TaxID=400727 RepID=UPI000D727734|nr:adhesion G-protein coupled receptor G2-like [Pomacea canaliculata]
MEGAVTPLTTARTPVLVLTTSLEQTALFLTRALRPPAELEEIVLRCLRLKQTARAIPVVTARRAARLTSASSTPPVATASVLASETVHSPATACPFYTGAFCDTFNPCLSNPCQNNATCHNNNGQYNCTCSPGYYGAECQHYGRCYGNPCNKGSCNENITEPLCSCPLNYYGFYCERYDPCLNDPCGGHGNCVGRPNTTTQGEDVDFVCFCASLWMGVRCENVNYCYLNACKNDAICENEPPNKVRCTCSPGFYEADCSRYNPCDALPGVPLCKNGGTCYNTTDGNFSCDCQYGYFGSQCQRRDPCLPIPCKNNGTCTNLTDTQFSCTCSEEYTGDLCQVLVLDLMEAGRRLSLLKNLTSTPSSLGTTDVDSITSALEKLYSFTLIKQSVAEDMMNVISNLADVNISITNASNKINATSDRLLKLLNDFSADVIVRNGNNVTMTSPNFEVVAVDVSDAASDVMYIPSIATGGSVKQLDVTITLPRQALELARGQASSLTVTRVQLAGHRKSQFFIPSNHVYSDDVIQTKPVITATIKGREIVNLTSPVVYKIRNPQASSNYTCVFWDPDNHAWSTEGVVTVSKSGNYTVCQSTHLTSFAVLLDTSPDFTLNSAHEMALTYISYIGSGLSLLCLVVTTLTYSLFRSLNKDKSGKILLNLCVALLLLNIVFLANGLSAGSDNSTRASCTAVAVILHYLLLASLAWMLVEAVEMYRALVTVFSKYAQCYMLKRCVVGWGVPVVIVAITLGISREHYHSSAGFCFLSRSSHVAYYASLVAPACLVLLVNTVIFFMVTRVILKPRFQQQKEGKEGITPGQVRGAFTVMFLLGVTWVFGPLAINEAKVVFNYLFCILNSLQGFLIFVFRCLFNPEARLAWVQLITTCTLKKRREPVRSGNYTDSSSKSDSHPKSSATEERHGRHDRHGRHGGGGHGGSRGDSYVEDDRL